jgi:hypothetical protein
MGTGRPTKYREEFDRQAYKLCLLGADDKRLADFLEVDVATVNRWKKSHPSFCESLKAGKLDADAAIAQSLYHRALGYSHKEEKVFNNQGEIVTHETVKHYPPDPTSLIFWLKNRQPTMWRDKHEVTTEQVVNHIMPVPVADSTESWEEAAKQNQDDMLG